VSPTPRQSPKSLFDPSGKMYAQIRETMLEQRPPARVWSAIEVTLDWLHSISLNYDPFEARAVRRCQARTTFAGMATRRICKGN